MEELQSLLEKSEMDMTLFFRNLSHFENEEQFKSFLETSTYLSLELFQNHWDHWQEWLQRYELRLMKESLSSEQRVKRMNQINPKYVLRNYMAQLAIDAADKGDYSLIEELYVLLKKPYDEQPEMQKWFAKRPDWAKEKVGCSMLSCSS
jgi:uncharacterized protein YdiU (UPF0061 family)